MAGLAVSAISGNSQTKTESPQNLVNPTANAALSSNVQTGTASSLLTAQTGILLKQTAPTTVSLNNTSLGTPITQTPTTTHSSKHHINVVLLGACIVVVVIAVAVFWIITRSAKNTTNYS
jgi:hypothetical protein